MILSLLRKKDMRIQDFMRRSFSEHNTTSQDESHAVYEAANFYLNEKLDAFKEKCSLDSGIQTCTFCSDSKMLDFYQTCAQYADISQELYDKLLVHGAIFKSLVPGRIVFVKSVTRNVNSKACVFKLAPVVLVEAFSKDRTVVLALSLDEISVVRNDEDELWEDEESTIEYKMTAFYEKTNSQYEALVEKLKNFKANEVQIPFNFASLASYKSIQNATLVQIKYNDIQAIANRCIQKSGQLNFDFSFAAVWFQCNAGQQQQRNQKLVQ